MHRLLIISLFGAGTLPTGDTRVGNCRAGGTGYALVFDGLRGSLVTMEWDMPQDEVTVEYWLKILDPHLSRQAVFAYSVYTTAGNFVTNEFAVKHSSASVWLEREAAVADVATAPPTTWLHVAVAWTADPARSPHGQLAVYINGSLVGNVTSCPHLGCDLGRPLHSGGEARRIQTQGGKGGGFSWHDSRVGPT